MSDDSKLPEVVQQNPDAYSINENGVIRNKRTGHLVKGSKSINPLGKPKIQKNLRAELQKRFGEDGKGLVKKLEEIILYDYDSHREDNPKVFKPKFEGHHQLKALELAMHYMFGRPSETIHVDQEVDLTIETKMHRVAKLINDNKDKLRLIQGGGVIDVITDAD